MANQEAKRDVFLRECSSGQGEDGDELDAKGEGSGTPPDSNIPATGGAILLELVPSESREEVNREAGLDLARGKVERVSTN